MLRNFNKEVDGVVHDLSRALRSAMASKQFSAMILLAAVRLSLLERKIGKAKDLTERRNHIHEFNRTKRAIQHGIGRIKESIPKTRTRTGFFRRTLP